MCRQVLRPFMTRRLKADLKDIMELPETREATIWCVFVRACVRAYASERARARELSALLILPPEIHILCVLILLCILHI